MTKIGYIDQWKGNIIQNMLTGILLGLALLPGAIAFSFIAGVNPTIGMLSTGLMMVVISITGNRRLLLSAPSRGGSVLVAPLAASYGMQACIFERVFIGTIPMIGGMCHINKLLNFIPTGVTIGFMDALGILIFTSHLEHILGISLATYIVALISFMM